LQVKPKFESDEHEKAWLIRVVINKSRNYIKRSWFAKNLPLTEDISYMPEEQSGVFAAVMGLDQKYRMPIHLFYYEGYSIQEIADILQTNSSTVKTWLSRGKQILKKKLGDFENE